jgi:hypothetical protein
LEHSRVCVSAAQDDAVASAYITLLSSAPCAVVPHAAAASTEQLSNS